MPRQDGRGDEGARGSCEVEDCECRERFSAQHHRADERQHAEGADAAVVHDGELGVQRRSAPQPVGRVGETVLVEGAGEGDQGQDGDEGGKPRRQVEGGGEPQDDGGREPDDGSDDGKGPERSI